MAYNVEVGGQGPAVNIIKDSISFAMQNLCPIYPMVLSIEIMFMMSKTRSTGKLIAKIYLSF